MSTISLSSHTNSGAKISALYTRFRIFKNIYTLVVCLFCCNGMVCLKKDPLMYVFVQVCFESHCFDKLLVFLNCDMKISVLA